jgi:hypothetical protein
MPDETFHSTSHGLGEVPVDNEKGRPSGTLGQGSGWKAIHSSDVEHFAIELFDSSKTGLKVSHLETKFRITKDHARSVAKRYCRNGILFAPENHKPQRYYPVERRPQVIEYLYTKKRLLPVQPTGTGQVTSHHALFNALENQKAANFLDLLRLLPLSPRYSHNIHLKTRIAKDYYGDLDIIPRNRTKGKLISERIGLREVMYTYYPAGSITMEVACSYAPFRISCEDDVNILFAFIGQVKDRMATHLSDPRERLVPDINFWILKECDVNVDIRLNDLGQVTLQDIQLSTMGRIFKAYVKILESTAVCRLEETISPNSPLLVALDSIIHPGRWKIR